MDCSLPSSKTLKSFLVEVFDVVILLIGNHRVHHHQAGLGLDHRAGIAREASIYPGPAHPARKSAAPLMRNGCHRAKPNMS